MIEGPGLLTFRLAWRNLWRHKRRTWLTASGLIFCNTLLVALLSFQLGTYDMMINNSLAVISGHAQIQHDGYLNTGKMRLVVPQAEELADEIRQANIGSAVSARGFAFALVSSERRSFGIQVMGVQPDQEPGVSSIPGLVSEGRYLVENDAAEIIIGRTMARNLKVGLGDELTLLGSGLDGSFAAGVVTVTGIYNTGQPDLDRSMAQVPLGYFQDTFTMGYNGHSIVISVDRLDQAEAAHSSAASIIAGQTDLVALDWDTLNPGVMQSIKSDLGGAVVMYAILIILVSFSVLNTQLMSVMERTREFGVIMALGVKPARLARLVALETALMALMGSVIGILIGAAITLYLSYAGINLAGMDEMAARFNISDRIYPTFGLAGLTMGPAVVFIFCMLASLYPALRLFRLQPVEAMRST